MTPARSIVQFGASALTFLALLVTASLGLWIGVPLAWLWIGSQVQAHTDNLGAAIGVMIVGVPLTLAAMVPILGSLTRLYQRSRVARGLQDTGTFPLEVMLTLTAMIGVGGGLIWFIFFQDSSPIPVQISF